MSIDEFIVGAARDVNAALNALLPAENIDPVRLHKAIRWSVFAGGKRVRPVVVFAVGETFAAPRTQLLRTAAAIEMVHTYSLIHDDLPSMDDDDLRRGKAACHRQFGEATAILAGDVLQTLAFKAIAEDDALRAETRVQIISLLGDAAGTPGGMVSGQQLDLEAEGRSAAIGEIEDIHRQKTGALIVGAAVAGAMIGHGTQSEVSAIREYAANLGLLFQITDDLLDATSVTDNLGKTAGKDAASAKATYTGFYGIEQAQEIAAKTHAAACAALTTLERDISLLRALGGLIARRTT